jgi:putative tryptophan/tyrosine transport system substrate-binding protein
VIDRRSFIRGLTCAVIARSHTVRGQTSERVWRIGFLRDGTHPIDPYFWVIMREYGWIEGQNVTLESRYASTPEQLPIRAAELVELKVDLIIAVGNAAAGAAKQATRSIPILFIVGSDPVERGLVASLARPGANVTGFTQGYYAPKMLEILKLTLPGIARVVLPGPPARSLNPALAEAARALGVHVSMTPIQHPDDIAGFFLAARSNGIDAVLISPDLPVWAEDHYSLIVVEAAKNRVPCIAWRRGFVELGGLMSFGPSPQHFRALVPQIDKIFKGAKPADIPVELAKKFELVINLKTAKSFGITIPQSILLRADEVIR